MGHQFPVKWPIAFTLVVFHVAAIVVAPFFATWNLVMLAFAVWTIVGSLGIGVCYHRLLTHQGFKTYKWLEYMLATLAAIALQGLATTWVAIHRIHHLHTEKPGLDPHTPREGKWWSHIDWMIHQDPQIQDREYLKKKVPDLARQAFYRQKYLLWLPTTVLGIICLLVGGIPAVLWGVTVPVFVGWHSTWFVNSATHLWGSRRFNTRDDSRNLWWVALITFGEGWHNNHHHDPMNPRHGIMWYEIDVNFYIIKCLQAMGLVWEVRRRKTA